MLLAQGVPARVVMEILGHSQLGITMNLYSHVMPSALREAADAIDERWGMTGALLSALLSDSPVTAWTSAKSL